MPAERSLDDGSLDDVVRIRIDTSLAVRDFLALLAEQAGEGETRAPAKPANRALFRELAPFRLVEYSYVDPGIGGIDGAYLGFADGSIYAVGDEIPEEVVDGAVAGDPGQLAPVYLYLLLEKPRAPEAVDRFMRALSAHMGKGLVAVMRDGAGAMGARAYEHADAPRGAALHDAVVKSALEADRHLSRSRVLGRYGARSESADGRAWAQITYNFTRHVAEFPSAAERNDFIEWSRILCEWIYARWRRWEDLGFPEVLRPAEPAPAPTGEIVPVRLASPSKALDGRPWQAFGGTDAATAQRFTESDAALSQEALDRSLALAREYWAYCTETIDAAEAKARQKAESLAKRQLTP